MSQFLFKQLREHQKLEAKQDLVDLDEMGLNLSWTLAQWEEALYSKNYLVFVGLVNHEIHGFALFHRLIGDTQAHLLKIVVDQAFRENGIGKNLFLFSKQKLVSMNVENCYLEVESDNLAALATYRSLGFEKLTLKKSFYSNGKDAYAMQLIF